MEFVSSSNQFKKGGRSTKLLPRKCIGVRRSKDVGLELIRIAPSWGRSAVGHDQEKRGARVVGPYEKAFALHCDLVWIKQVCRILKQDLPMKISQIFPRVSGGDRPQSAASNYD